MSLTVFLRPASGALGLRVAAALALVLLIPAACSGSSKADKLREQGLLLKKNNKTFDAIEKFNESLKVAEENGLPPNPDVQLLLVDSYLDVREPKLAVAEAGRLLGTPGIDPKLEAQARFRLGKAELLQINPQDVLTSGTESFDHFTSASLHAARLLELHPDSADARLLQAHIDTARSEFDAARAGYEAIIAADPRHEAARLGLISVLLQQNQPVEAEELARAMVAETDKPSSELISKLGLSLAAQGRYDDAWNLLHDRLAEATPDLSFEEHRLLGDILLAQARQALRPLMRSAPIATDELTTVTDRLEWLGAEMKGRYPQHPHSWYFRGKSHEFRAFIPGKKDANTTDTGLITPRDENVVTTGPDPLDLREAISHYQRAVSLSRGMSGEHNRNFRFDLATANLMAGNYEQTRQDLRALLQESAGDIDARYLIAKSYMDEGQALRRDGREDDGLALIARSGELIETLARDLEDSPVIRPEILQQLKGVSAQIRSLNPNPEIAERGRRELADLGFEAPPGATLDASADPRLAEVKAAFDRASAARDRRDGATMASALSEARQILRRMAEEDPDSSTSLLRLLQFDAQKGDLVSALAIAAEGSRIDPSVFQPLQAGLLARLGQRRSARDILEPFAAAPGARIEPALQLAQLRLQTGAPDQALALYDQLIEANPADIRPVLGRALVLAESRSLEEATAYLADRVPRTSDPQLRIAYARMLMQVDEPAAAVEQFDAITTEIPRENARRLVEKGIAQLIAAEYEGALQTAAEALDADSLATLEAGEIKAVASLGLGRPADALAALGAVTQAVRAAGATPPPTHDLLQAVAHLAAGNISASEQLVSASPGLNIAARNLFSRMINRSDPDALRPAAPLIALQILLSARPIYARATLGVADQALARLPDEPFLLARRVEALQLLGRLEEAIATFDRIIAVMPEYALLEVARADLQLALARRLADEGGKAAADRQVEETTSRLAAALERNPKDAALLEKLGVVYQQQDRIEDANALYEQLLIIDPDKWTAYNNLAWNWLQAGELDRAAGHGERALALVPGHGGVLDTMGLIELERGNVPEAVKMLRQAALALPNNPEVRHHLARALEANGEIRPAREELEAIELSSPDYEGIDEVREMLARLQSRS